MFRVIHFTMFSAPNPLIRRTVLGVTRRNLNLSLLSLPNDTIVDLILVRLCVRDILRLRSVCIRHLWCYVSMTPSILGMQTILRTNAPTGGLEAHLAHLSPSTAATASHHPLFDPFSQQPRGRTTGYSCPRRRSKLEEYDAQIL